MDRSLDSTSCEAKIVSDCKTILALHRAKPRLSCEDKGKMPACFAEDISREVRTATMPSPDSGAVTPHANLVLLSEVTDSTAATTPISQGARGVPSRQAGAKAPNSANHLREKVANKAPQRALLPGSSSVKFTLVVELRDYPWVLIAVLMQLQRLRVLPKFLAAKLELKHYLVSITSMVMRGTMHQPVSFPKLASKKVMSKLTERINA